MNWHMYAIFMLIAALTLITGCSMIIKEPQIDVKNVEITSATLQEVDT